MGPPPTPSPHLTMSGCQFARFVQKPKMHGQEALGMNDERLILSSTYADFSPVFTKIQHRTMPQLISDVNCLNDVTVQLTPFFKGRLVRS